MRYDGTINQMNDNSDIFNKEKRSELMSKVHSKNTKPELKIRSALHRHGFRFRLYRKDIPGCPDITLSKYKTVILIHGCFWHQHPGCKKATIPKNNHDFWHVKLNENIKRDERIIMKLQELGWKVIVIWECDIKRDLERVISLVVSELLNSKI